MEPEIVRDILKQWMLEDGSCLAALIKPGSHHLCDLMY